MNLQPLVRLARFFCCFLLAHCLNGCATAKGMTSLESASIARKTVVITGASSGFGRGVAYRLAALHANVVLAARRTSLLCYMADDLKALGGTPLIVTTDVSNYDAMRHLAERTLASFGRIDVWINNAGVGAFGRFDEIPAEDHARIIDVNLKGVIFGSHLAVSQFKKQGFGTLINVGSIDSEIPMAYQSSYAASKAAILSLGRIIHQELRLSGHDEIAVATLMPWGADTPFFSHAANYSGHALKLKTLDNPGIVVEAMVELVRNPEKERTVGWKAKLAYVAHRVLPGITERVAANRFHEMLFEQSERAKPTSGNLYRPRPGIRIPPGEPDCP